MNVLQEGKRVINCEIEALTKIKDSLNSDFEFLVNEIIFCKGSTVITGMGKTGLICRKITASMQSLGIKSNFLHPSEGLHGDLGILTKDDIIIAFSNSGETDEILALIPSIKLIGAKLLSVVGHSNSTLQHLSMHSVVLPKIEEAFHGNIVPTSSTTAFLALGDALAVTVAYLKDFKETDFAIYHPRGQLGKRLTLTVDKIMIKGTENAVISEESTVREAVFEMCSKPIGGVNIINKERKLCGVFTDGDLRRLINSERQGAMDLKISTLMTERPMIFHHNLLVSDAIDLINANNKGYSFFPVVTSNNTLLGSVRMLDITKSGLMER